MSRTPPKADPILALDYFSTGFFSYRSALFAPFKSIGINVIQFRDPILSGSNCENTDTLQIQRRPGFSVFCSEPLPDSEIVNQFYSSRDLNGIVTPWVDTTKRWASFSDTSINTIVAKTTTDQGYLSTVGNMTYFSDGASADLYKFDGTNLSVWGLAPPTIAPICQGFGEFWQPFTKFPIGASILDTNGNIESVSSILIPNGSIESPTFAETLALGGSLAGTWVFDPINGGYEIPLAGYNLVQQGIANSLSATVTYTFPSPVTMGNVIVLDFGEGTINFLPTVISVTDNLGNVYAQQAFGTGAYPGGGGAVYYSSQWVWSAPITVAGICTVTVTTSGLAGAPILLNAYEFFGISATATTASSNYAVHTGSLSTGSVSFSGTELVLSSMLLFSTGSASTPAGYTPGEYNPGSEWQLFDAYYAETGSADPVYLLQRSDGQALGNTVVFPLTSLNLGYSPYLFLGSFNLSIPSSATIVGIQVSVPKQDLTFGIVTDYSVRLIVGGAVVGNNYASGAAWSASGYAATIYGGPADLWGLTPTPTDLSANGPSGFGIAISALITALGGGSVVPEVGYTAPNAVTVTVYYKQSNGLGGPGVSGANEPIWSTSVSGVVNDGGLTWTNYGPIQTWYPTTGYPTPIVILDTNGNLQLSTSVANPIPAWQVGTGYTTGSIVYFGGQYWIDVFNGTNTGVVPSANYASTGGSVTAPYWALTTTPVVTGLIAPVWNTTIGGTTVDGSYTWTNIGHGTGLAFTGYAYVYGYRTIYGHLTTSSPFSANTGAILGPLNGSITSYQITSNVITFTGDNNFVFGNVIQMSGLSVGTFLNEETATVLTAVPSESFPLTNVAVVANVLTIFAVNNLVSGQKVTFSGIGTATFLNGLTVTVLGSGLSNLQFAAIIPSPSSYASAADVGTVSVIGSYTATFIHADVPLTLDSGVATPLTAAVTGAGTASPLCNSVANITSVSISADIVTITASNNFQPGLWVTLEGLANASFLNNQQLQVIAVDQPVGTQNTYFQVYFVNPDYSETVDVGTATFNAIEIYRTSDGGGTYLFAGAVTNPILDPAPRLFIFYDFVTDANLDALLVAPLSHQNDPPPGGPGSSIITTGDVLVYWQGRLWQANRNYVYFDAGPDCTNGIPEESWPPANRFQFAGPVLNMVPTADGVGLLVYLADRVNVILGGPETISFYATDALSNFGISNPNAIFRDGSIIGQFTTQRQYFELVNSQKQETGQHIADYLEANFQAASTYVTMHRDGLDVGVFLSNGVDQVIRYGSNISAWSVPAFPLFGAGALNSIETSVGVTTLMLASPNGGVTSSTNLHNPTSAISVGAGTPWINPSGIIESAATHVLLTSGTSQTLRASAYPISIPSTATVQGVQVLVVGSQNAAGISLTLTPTNPVAGATSDTFTLNATSPTVAAGLPTFFTLEDSGGFLWSVSVTDAGFIQTTKGITGTAPNVYMNDSAGDSWQLTITTGGDFQPVSVTFNSTYPAGIVLDSPSNFAWFLRLASGPPYLQTVPATVLRFGGDLWGMPWSLPSTINAGALSFDIVATYESGVTPEVAIAEIQVSVTYQNPGNYLYARDVNSWGDGGTFGANNGTPYDLCDVVIGSITLSQPGAELVPLQHVVLYADAVGTLNNGGPSYPSVWIMPNEISDTKGIGFVFLPEVVQEPPIGTNHASASLLSLRFPVNMANSFQMSQYVHHVQLKVQFQPENAPNTIKAISLMGHQDT